jgi:hypothetical protein
MYLTNDNANNVVDLINSKEIVSASSKLLKIVYWVMKEKREYTN